MVAHLRADPICGGLYSASDIANIGRPQENVTTVETPSTSSTPAFQDDLRDPTSIQGKSEWHLVENRKRRSQASSNVEAMCSKKSKPDRLPTSESSKAIVKKPTTQESIKKSKSPAMQNVGIKTNSNKEICEYCNQSVSTKNLKSHQDTNKKCKMLQERSVSEGLATCKNCGFKAKSLKRHLMNQDEF